MYKKSNIKIRGNLINHLANTVNKILISAEYVLMVVLQEGKKNIIKLSSFSLVKLFNNVKLFNIY